MNLAGLGYIAGGLSQGLDAGTRRRLEDLQAQAMQQSISGQKDAGNALMSLSGVTPAQSQQSQGLLGGLAGMLRGGAPQQPATPMQLQGAMPQQAPQQPAAPMQLQAQPQQGAVPPQLANAAWHLDFPTLTKTLAQAPGMTPERLMSALSALQPYMNMQSQNDYKMAMMQIQRQNADTRAAGERDTSNYHQGMLKIAGQNADTKQAGQQSLDAYRQGKLGIDQAKIDQAGQHLAQIERAAGMKDLATAESNFRGLQAVRVQARQQVGTDDDPTVKAIDAQIGEAQKQLDRLRSPTPADKGGAKSTQRVTPAAKPAPEGGATQQGAPKPGDVMQGYRFKGGDPSKKENWEKV